MIDPHPNRDLQSYTMKNRNDSAILTSTLSYVSLFKYLKKTVPNLRCPKGIHSCQWSHVTPLKSPAFQTKFPDVFLG